ncbi:MAG: DUF4159 domain-containing protein [Victivallaceae bacterium]|nr:DUF4159 domain-containing protein [Victivallaceae bacterium]
MKRLILFLAALWLGSAAICADGSRQEFESTRGSRVSWARLKFKVKGYNPNGNPDLGWFYHPQGDIRVVEWLRANTDVNILQEWNIVDVKNLDHMCAFPMLFLSGKGAIDLAPAEKNNLREYLLRGGVLFCDDCVALHQPVEDVFFRSMVRLVKEVLPGVRFTQLKQDHPIWHCYYDMKTWTHLQGKNNGLWGAWYEGRLVMVIDSGDLHCGWTGFHFSNNQRIGAFQWAANICVYLMSH